MRTFSLARAVLWLGILLFAGCSGWRQRSIPLPGIAQEERVTLGGYAQTIFIRGRDRNNPVLLFLHGGPGLPEMPFSHVNAALEKSFTMVYWDQLGTGKSYQPNIPASRMTVEHFVADTQQLSRYLGQRFGQKKIYLVGYSWGSLLGALAASRSPELYRAYIGVSQLVDVPESNLILHREATRAARARGKSQLVATMNRVGEPPYPTAQASHLAGVIEKEMQPPAPHEMTKFHYFLLGLQSPYYSWSDDRNVLKGMKFSNPALSPDMRRYDLFRDAPEIDVPVTIILGQHDILLSPTLGERYFHFLRAPKGKTLVVFRTADHNLHLEQPALFRQVLLQVLAQTR